MAEIERSYCSLYGTKDLIAIEVKRSKQINSEDLTALKAFHVDYPVAKCYILYGGTKRLYFEGIEAVPIVEALKSLPTLI